MYCSPSRRAPNISRYARRRNLDTHHREIAAAGEHNTFAILRRLRERLTLISAPRAHAGNSHGARRVRVPSPIFIDGSGDDDVIDTVRARR